MWRSLSLSTWRLFLDFPVRVWKIKTGLFLSRRESARCDMHRLIYRSMTTLLHSRFYFPADRPQTRCSHMTQSKEIFRITSRGKRPSRRSCTAANRSPWIRKFPIDATRAKEWAKRITASCIGKHMRVESSKRIACFTGAIVNSTRLCENSQIATFFFFPCNLYCVISLSCCSSFFFFNSQLGWFLRENPSRAADSNVTRGERELSPFVWFTHCPSIFFFNSKESQPRRKR